MRHQMGLDKPLPVRYAHLAQRSAPGRSGQLDPQPATGLDADRPRLPDHALSESLLAAHRRAIAVPAGTIAALRRNTWLDRRLHDLGVSRRLDSRVLAGDHAGLHLRRRLRGCPCRDTSARVKISGASLKTMILPAFTLGVFLSGPLTRYLRSSMLQTLSQEYVLVARPKGLAERRVDRRAHPAQLADSIHDRARDPVRLPDRRRGRWSRTSSPCRGSAIWR